MTWLVPCAASGSSRLEPFEGWRGGPRLHLAFTRMGDMNITGHLRSNTALVFTSRYDDKLRALCFAWSCEHCEDLEKEPPP